MPILYQEADRTFFLQTPSSTYAFSIHDHYAIPRHLFWGLKTEPADFTCLRHAREVSFSACDPDSPSSESLDWIPQELSTFGHGDFRVASLTVGQPDGSRLLELRYRTHRIKRGKPMLPGLPATYVENDDEAETLEVDLADELTGLAVTLLYTVFRDFDVIARSIRVRNDGPVPVQLETIASVCIDLQHEPMEVVHLPGAWARERHIHRQPPSPGGRFVVESRRGASSHQQHPFLALCDPSANEKAGEVFGFSLVYSGSFCASVEADQFGRQRVVMGLNPEEFSWQLGPGGSFQTPEVVLVYSALGLGTMSRTYHELYRTRLARGTFRDAVRPCLLNNWEATYMDFNEARLLSLAGKAAEVGIELFVLDDGWFGKRDNAKSSLGDWAADLRKLPHGIDALARNIHARGLKFGLWFEPEMVSPDSNLHRAHPDWCLHVPGRSRSVGRFQLVLDLSRAEVCDYIVESLSTVLRSGLVSYLKWDMNRHLTEVGSAALPAHRQREVPHRYVLGLYQILQTLTTRFPNVLFEGCSGGGGRFDPGMLHYMPQHWTSDNTDPISRLKIQHGTSLLYPWSSLGAHVSAVPNHQHGRTSPLDTRFHVALTGAFGYELDLEKLQASELASIKEQVEFYKRHRQLLTTGALYRLKSPFTSNEAAWMLVAKDGSEALVVQVTIQVEANQAPTLLRLEGLLPAQSYQVSGMDRPHRGDALMNVGLPVPPPSGDFASHCWYLSAR